MSLAIVAPQVQRLDVRRNELVFAPELLADELFDFCDIDVEQCSEGADIDNVAKQLALARIGISVVADFGQWHADDTYIIAKFGLRQGFGRIVKQITARIDARHVLVPGLRIHRDHEIDAAARAEIAGFRNAHFIPGGQPLNVGWKDIARADRHAHSQNGLCEKLIGRCRTGAVDVRELNDEVVYFWLRHAGPACVTSRRNLRMSQAPVGQRSAHSPQCRQTSSSLAMIRPVLSTSDIYKLCDSSSADAFSRLRNSISSPFSVNVMQSIGQISTHASHSMQSGGENTVWTSQLRQR